MISIQLDNPKGYFLSGETVTGRVLFSITPRNFDMRCLTKATLKCQGQADVNFHKVKYGLPLGFKASEEFFRITNIPLSDVPPATNDKGKWNYLLRDKQYSCPFSFDLPASTPSSVEGIHGRVRFTLKAEMHIWITSFFWPDSSQTERTKIAFPVVKLVDLNVNPLAKMPVSVTGSKNLFERGGQNGPVTVNAWLNQSGYATGEVLYLNGTVENLSGKTMMGTTVQLLQVIKYCAKGDQKFSSRVIREATHGSFDRTDDWSNVPFLIPNLPPTDEGLYKLIQISYRIEFVFDPGLHGSRFTVPMEVIIGSVPLAVDQQNAATVLPLGNVHPPVNEDSLVTDENACLMSFE